MQYGDGAAVATQPQSTEMVFSTERTSRTTAYLLMEEET